MLLTLLSPQGAAGTVTAVLAATEAKDTAAISASVGLVAVLAATEAQDTAAISATVVSYTAALAATEAKDTAAISATFSVAGITAILAATEAKDVAAIAITIGGGPTEQFTVSGPHVTDIFTTSTLSYPYDIKKRTA